MKRSTMSICGMAAGLMVTAAGCGPYENPGASNPPSADALSGGTHIDWAVQASADARPAAILPAAIAVARVEPGCLDDKDGQLQIAKQGDIEDPKLVDEWRKLPGVAGIAPLDTIVVSGNLITRSDLRRVAASLHADFLFIYTVSSDSKQYDLAWPLTIATLGFAPDQGIHVNSTVSGILIDTKSGYLYGTCQATEKRDVLTVAWWIQPCLDEATRSGESAAFTQASSQLKLLWTDQIAAAKPR